MTQLDLFAEPGPVDSIAPTPTTFDAAAWSQAQNTTPTRCDRCSNWKRTLSNYWGECSTRNSYEHEYGGNGCEAFSPDPAEAIYRARGYDAYGRTYP